MKRMPTYFLSHGGGPWPYMEGTMREHLRTLEQSLRELPQQLPERPRAVLVVSAHWEAQAFTVSSSAMPPMLYDYSGFPPEMYRISYPAPGSPDLARQVKGLIQRAGLPAAEDAKRGFDHGTFSLLKPIYPEADLPVVQLSLKQDFDPLEHIKVGQVLAPLRDEGILILGSGYSYHNMSRFGPTATQPSGEFDHWLRLAVAAKPEERLRHLTQWEQAPAARLAHPREDHLMPLMVIAGAAGNDPVTMAFGDHLFGAATSSFRFSSDERPTGFDRLGIM